MPFVRADSAKSPEIRSITASLVLPLHNICVIMLDHHFDTLERIRESRTHDISLVIILYLCSSSAHQRSDGFLFSKAAL